MSRSFTLALFCLSFLSLQIAFGMRNDTIIFATTTSYVEFIFGAPLYAYTRLGLQVWERMCNAEGGIKLGNTSYKVQLITVDHNEKGVEKTWEELVMDPTIDFFFPPFGSSGGEIAASVAKDKILISASATRNSFIKNHKYTLSLQTAGEKFWRQPLIHLRATSTKTIALIQSEERPHPMCDNGDDLVYNGYNVTQIPMLYDGDKIDDSDPSKPLFDRNYSIPFDQWNKTLQTNLTEIASQLCGIDVVVLCSWSFAPRPVLMKLIKDECEEGENTPMVMMGSAQLAVPTIDEYWKYQLTVTHTSNGILFDVPENRTIEYLKDEIDANRTEEEEAYISQGITAFFAGEIMKQGIEAAGTLDKDVVFETIKTSYFDTAFGRYQWDASRLQERELVVFQHVPDENSDSQYSFIGPLRILNRAEFIHPIPTWKEREFPSYPKNDAEIALTVIALIFILSSLILLVLLFLHWNHTVIRAASPSFMALMLFGSILLYSSPFTFIPTLIRDVTCILRFWLIGLGFVICVGAFVAKTWRIYALYSNRAVEVTRISDKKIWIIISILVTIEIVLLIFLTVFGDIERDITLEDPHRNSTAEFDCYLKSVGFRVIITLNGIYFLLLIVYGSFLSIKLRKIKFKMYNESTIMAFSFYNLIFFAILVAIISSVGMENNTEYIVSSSLIILGTAITIFSLFAQKLHFMMQGTKQLKSSGTSSKFSDTSIDLRITAQTNWKKKYEELSISFDKVSSSLDKVKRSKRKWKKKYYEVAPDLSEEFNEE